jgi:hypothetical protein
MPTAVFFRSISAHYMRPWQFSAGTFRIRLPLSAAAGFLFCRFLGKAALGEQNRRAASAELLGPHRLVMSGRGPGPIVDLRRLGVHLGRPGLESRWWS